MGASPTTSAQEHVAAITLGQVRCHDARQDNAVESPRAADAGHAGGDFGNVAKMEEIRADERAEHAGNEGNGRGLIGDEEQGARRGNQRGKHARHRNADPFDRPCHPVTDQRVDDDRKEQPREAMPALYNKVGDFVDCQADRNKTASDIDGDDRVPA